MYVTTDETLDDANIIEYADKKSALDDINSRSYGLKAVELEPIYSSDTFAKLYERPDIDKDGNTLFRDHQSGIDILCRVFEPGTHPGGKVYWLEPVDTVYKPVFIETEEET